jgi:hypothetical protein
MVMTCLLHNQGVFLTLKVTSHQFQSGLGIFTLQHSCFASLTTGSADVGLMFCCFVLTGLYKLEELDLGFCGKVTNNDMLAVTSLTSLTSLRLSRTGVSSHIWGRVTCTFIPLKFPVVNLEEHCIEEVNSKMSQLSIHQCLTLQQGRSMTRADACAHALSGAG